MPWRLASPGHQQPWYWSFMINRVLLLIRNDFNCLYKNTHFVFYGFAHRFSCRSRYKCRHSPGRQLSWRHSWPRLRGSQFWDFLVCYKDSRCWLSLRPVRTTTRNSWEQMTRHDEFQWSSQGFMVKLWYLHYISIGDIMLCCAKFTLHDIQVLL